MPEVRLIVGAVLVGLVLGRAVEWLVALLYFGGERERRIALSRPMPRRSR